MVSESGKPETMLDAISQQSWLHHADAAAETDSEEMPCGIQSIGRYEILRPLQNGATSSVFIAKDVYSGDKVALKHVKLPNPDDSFHLAEHETWVHQQVITAVVCVRVSVCVCVLLVRAIVCIYVRVGEERET